MPKRVLDGEGIWGSTKLARCPEWMRAEYAWLYPLADAYGCFELTSIAVIRGKVAPHRTKLTEKRLLQIFDEFHERGLLFVWLKNGRKYGYWTGSDRSGRLPRPSRRSKNYEKVLTPIMPRKELREYLQGLGEPTERRLPDGDASSASASVPASAKASASVPKHPAQASPSPLWKHLRLTGEQLDKLGDWYSEFDKMDLWLDANPKRRKKNYYAFAVRWINRITRADGESAKEAAVGSGPQTEGKFGKCSDCGLPTAPGFTKCYPCTTKKAPVNP